MSRWKVHGFIPIWVVNRDMRAFGRYNANYGCPQLRRKVACLHSLVAGPAAESRNRDPEAVAVVIGSSRGIGLAITQELIRRFQGAFRNSMSRGRGERKPLNIVDMIGCNLGHNT